MHRNNLLNLLLNVFLIKPAYIYSTNWYKPILRSTHNSVTDQITPVLPKLTSNPIAILSISLVNNHHTQFPQIITATHHTLNNSHEIFVQCFHSWKSVWEYIIIYILSFIYCKNICPKLWWQKWWPHIWCPILWTIDHKWVA